MNTNTKADSCLVTMNTNKKNRLKHLMCPVLVFPLFTATAAAAAAAQEQMRTQTSNSLC